jgi:hypothetical protein
MLILFDNGTPRGIASSLQDHTVREARALGWDTLSNGELLKSAGEAGFDVLLTTDRSIAYQQNLERRKIAIVVLGKGRWRLIKLMLPQVVATLNAAKPGSCTVVDIPDR